MVNFDIPILSTSGAVTGELFRILICVFAFIVSSFLFLGFLFLVFFLLSLLFSLFLSMFQEIMEMELDIDEMILEEYVEYDREQTNIFMRNLRSRKAATRQPPLEPFLPNFQPYTNANFQPYNMTIQEYELYMVKQCRRKNSLNNHTHGFTSNFIDYSQNTPDP